MFAIYFGSLLKELENKIGLKNLGAYADDLLAIIRGKDTLKKVLISIKQWANEHKS